MFHSSNNWFFQRLKDGRVEISHRIPDRTSDPSNWKIDAIHNIDQFVWASIVSTVSKNGETADTWKEALDFHAGEEVTT